MFNVECISLETKRLSLKPLSLVHLSNEYVKWMNDSEVIKHLESGGDYSIEKLEEFLKDVESKDILFWAIHIKNSNKHIGNIKIDPVDSKINSGEYGIMMGDKSEWGKGFAYEASQSVINYCFNTLGLKQITLGVKNENIGAIKLYKKLNFDVYSEVNDTNVEMVPKLDSIRMILCNDK